MQGVLQLVFLMEAGCRRGCFGPEVGDFIRSAELERDEVVDFVGASRMRGDAVRAKDFLLCRFRHIPHRLRVAGFA